MDKTITRIEGINNGSTAKITNGGSPTAPSLSDIQAIRNYEFKIDADTPALRSAVQNCIELLKLKYPGYNFSAQFGGK